MPTFRLTRSLRMTLSASAAMSGDVTLDGVGTANAFTLSGPSTGTTGVASTFYATPNGTMGTTVVVTPAATNAGSVSPTSLTFTAGSSAAQSFTVTRATDGTSSVSITNAGGLSNLGTPISFSVTAALAAQDWGTRISQPSVVWHHGFESDAEVTTFQSAAPIDGVTGDRMETLGGYLRRVLDDRGFWCLEQVVIGSTLAQAYTHTTGVNQTMVLDDITDWPQPSQFAEGHYYVIVMAAYPTFQTQSTKNLFRVTDLNTATKTITVTRIAYGSSAFNASPQNYSAGALIGQQAPGWQRVFSALIAGQNAKFAADAAASGTLPRRSLDPADATYGVPVSGTNFQHGAYGHPDDQALWQTWTPWVGGTTYATRGGAAGTKDQLWDGHTFHLQVWVKINASFFVDHPMPADNQAFWSRKAWVLDTTKSVPQQLVNGIGAGNNKWSIPSTYEQPWKLATNRASYILGDTDKVRYNPPLHRSWQPGSQWDVAPWYAWTEAGNGGAPAGAAWEMPADKWVCFTYSVTPGHSQVDDHQIKVQMAEVENPAYAGQHTLLMDLTDAHIWYGDGSNNYYPAGAFSYPTVPNMDALPGWNAFTLFGYLNFYQDYSTPVFRRSHTLRLGNVIFSKSPIAPPPREEIPAWVPSTGNTWAAVTATNSLESLIPSYYLSTAPGRAFHEYSSSALNPYWGRYGAVFGHGGGHSSSNYDGTWCMDLSQTGITFRRLVAPTHFFTDPNDTGTWTVENRTRNFGTLNYPGAQAEASTDGWVEPIGYGGVQRVGHPAANHSYQSLVVIGPAHGGAAHGTLVAPAKGFAMFSGWFAGLSAHRMDFATTAGATDSYSWQRWGAPTVIGDIATNCALVNKQNRIYYGNIKVAAKPGWFDLATGTFQEALVGEDARWRRSEGGAGQALIYIQELDLLVAVIGNNPDAGDFLVVDYARVRVSDTLPNWEPATLGSSIPFPMNGAAGISVAATWCADNQRLIVGGIFGDPNCVYEIAIPATLTDPWPVERVPFTPPAGFSWPAADKWPIGWTYNPKIKACLSLPVMAASGPDTVFVYRPRGV